MYGGAVKEVMGDPISGELVQVLDYRGNLIGRGFYNPNSQYRVRMLILAHEQLIHEPMEVILHQRILEAFQLRQNLQFPSEMNTAYRLVNGEGDRLSGLMVDVFGNRAIVQSAASWAEINRDIITQCLSKVVGKDYSFLWRTAEARLKQDGYELPATVSAPKEEGHDDLNDNILVKENGLQFHVNTKNAQKTGFYCDQRDNRAMLGSLSRGKSVLDLYCYSAGFSIYAAKGGASKYYFSLFVISF